MNVKNKLLKYYVPSPIRLIKIINEQLIDKKLCNLIKNWEKKLKDFINIIWLKNLPTLKKNKRKNSELLL